MEPTFIGVAQVVIGGLLLLVGSVPAMLAFVLLSGLMGGSAALILPALSGSSVPPVDLALVFLLLRLMPKLGRSRKPFGRAARDLAPLAVFVLYGALMAYIGPRLFAGHIDVTPLKPRDSGAHYTNLTAFIYSTRPLAPTSQNITTSIYLIGTLVLAFAAHMALSTPRGRDTLVRTGVAIGFLHSALGILSLIGKGTAVETVLALFRNGSYAQLDHSYNGFSRITGIWPEASGFGTYGLMWMIFLTECALRGVRPRATGLAAIALLATLALSTSTTAYVGIMIYAAILAFRVLAFPGAIRLTSLLTLGVVVLCGGVIVLGVMATAPGLASSIGNLLLHFTVDKGNSLSGRQRSFWAQQGWDAFVASYGLGIGPGSFRSSSIATAILGSTGLIGTLAFSYLLIKLWKPWRRSTFAARGPDPAATGAAAAWTCLVLIVVQSIASPTPDPGADFAILASAALALRRMRLVALPIADATTGAASQPQHFMSQPA